MPIKSDVTKAAEANFALILRECDDANALKTRDEFLGFRRRMRLFNAVKTDAYREHMLATLRRLNEYSTWFNANPALFDQAPRATSILHEQLFWLIAA